MTRQIYVNLPVRDLDRSKQFFGSLGFHFEPRYTNDSAACLVVAPDIRVMLLTQGFFKGFTGKPLADARECTEVLVCISCESRAEVDELVARARSAGGSVPRQAQDHGFMYGHGFEDLDGHIWELVYMEPAAPD